MAWKPHADSTKLLFAAQRILNEYSFMITFKQLYYRLVEEDHIDNSVSSFRKLSTLITNARKHGRLSPSLFVAPESSSVPTAELDEYLKQIVETYHVNRTLGQGNYVEVWVERAPVYQFMKEILAPFDIPIYMSQGYSSYSFTHQAYRRIHNAINNGQVPRILCFFDLSVPSYNIFDSILNELSSLFEVSPDEICSLLFTVGVLPEHIIKFDLPADPTLIKDSRSVPFDEKYGDILEIAGISKNQRYEIEAIEPSHLRRLTFNSVFSILDYSQLLEIEEEEHENKQRLEKLIRALDI